MPTLRGRTIVQSGQFEMRVPHAWITGFIRQCTLALCSATMPFDPVCHPAPPSP